MRKHLPSVCKPSNKPKVLRILRPKRRAKHILSNGTALGGMRWDGLFRELRKGGVTMGLLEVVCLTVVLLLSLYGAACVVTWAVWRVTRPANTSLMLLAAVDEDAAEWQVRFALETAGKTGLPLWVVGDTMSEETTAMVCRLCGAERVVGADELRKILRTTCTAPEKRV